MSHEWHQTMTLQRDTIENITHVGADSRPLECKSNLCLFFQLLTFSPSGHEFTCSAPSFFNQHPVGALWKLFLEITQEIRRIFKIFGNQEDIQIFSRQIDSVFTTPNITCIDAGQELLGFSLQMNDKRAVYTSSQRNQILIKGFNDFNSALLCFQKRVTHHPRSYQTTCQSLRT